MLLWLSRFYLIRVLTQGRLYIVAGLAIPLLFTIAAFVGNQSSPDLGGILIAYPMIMPVTGIWGIIPLVTYLASDRRSGFFEHLFATSGINANTVYSSLSVVAISVTSIPVFILLAISFAASSGGVSLPSDYVYTLLVYSIPVSYIAPLLVLVVASTWSFTTMAFRGPFTSTPAGIVPVLGLVIALVPIFVQSHLGSFPVIQFLGIYTISTFLLIVILLYISLRIMRPERFLP